jgi:glucosyl-3-phosphoglycerate synthase
MSDFHQTGVVATLHRLGPPDLARMEAELEYHAAERPIALVLPCLLCELENAPLRTIVSTLSSVPYLKEVVVTLGPASREEFLQARRYFSPLPQQVRIIWNSGPRVSRIYDSLREAGLETGEEGKGRSSWMAFGYVLARESFHSVTLHDCDIGTYSRELLARLCYPVTSPRLSYDFCKGYYSRVTDRMYGRVTRLLVTPLLRSLMKIVGHHPLLVFFDSFRYPLAGEFSMEVELARINRIPGDWGLEMGMLAEVFHNAASRKICQSEITDSYDHKHREISPADPTRGLHRMSIDICTTIFHNLAAEGVVFSEPFFNTLVPTYVGMVYDLLRKYEDDSAMNGLVFDRHQESLAVETFTKGMRQAARKVLLMEEPLGLPLITSWSRAVSALPGVLGDLLEAVESDNSGT